MDSNNVFFFNIPGYLRCTSEIDRDFARAQNKKKQGKNRSDLIGRRMVSLRFFYRD